jgi:D-tyrosyl-tRNA(Tyr) deacylase
VAEASVLVDGREVGHIGPGLVVLLGVARDDAEEDAQYLVEKLTNLRIFADEENRFNRSALDVGAEFLLVSQFTLYADTRKGRRPDFTQAAQPQEAQRLYEYAVELCRRAGFKVETGRFQEYMQVRLQNDGPVTLLLDSADRRRPRRP